MVEEEISILRSWRRMPDGYDATSKLVNAEIAKLGDDGKFSDLKKIDKKLGLPKGTSWEMGGYAAWYADKRMKGWDFDSTVPTPKDYGVAEWNGRAVEAVIAQIRVLMKNRTLGKYSDDCWNVGYLVDKEFSMKREPFTRRCKDDDALKTWQTGHSFKTRWDLGIK